MALITPEQVAARVRAAMDFTGASPMTLAAVFYGTRPAEQAAPYVVMSVAESSDPVRESGGPVLQRFTITMTGWVVDPAYTPTMAALIRSWLDPLVAAGSTGWPAGTTMGECYAIAPGVDDLQIDQRPGGEAKDVKMTVFKAVVTVSPP